MKKIILAFILTLLGICAYSQDNWINKEVGNNIFVKFPSSPNYTYKSQEKSGIFGAKTENCLFMAMIQFGIIPYYSEFIKLQVSDQGKVLNQLLDNYIKGRSLMTNKEILSKSIKLGTFTGRELTYGAVNPVTGEVGQRFSKVFVVNDKIYSFECWYLNNSTQSENEKNMFLNSIMNNR